MSIENEHIIRDLKYKSEPITQYELKILRKAFQKKLADKGIRQTQWCEENRVSDSLLVNTLAGRTVSRPVIHKLTKWVL
jgi:hypothetical protein